MNLNILINQKFQENENQIFICNENDFNRLKLSDNQKSFLIKKADKDTKIIEFNHYGYYIYVINTKAIGKSNPSEFYRIVGNDVITKLNKNKQKRLVIFDFIEEKEILKSLVEGIVLGGYQFLKYFKEKDSMINTVDEITIQTDVLDQPELDALLQLLKAVYIARDLGNEPYSSLNSLQLSKEIIHFGNEAGFSVRVMDKQEIEDEGMGGLLAVNKGSHIPATFSVLEWKPKNATNEKPIVLVGKGLVFDSGGYSLKPTKSSMDMMKLDMAGAAAVIGIFYAISKNKLPLRVIGLIPATDNAIGSKAYVPGDIIEMHNGLFVEVLNTDAEGRLILGDALSYAKKFNPELVIDLATLTGSAATALGSEASVVMGTADESLFNRLTDCGERVYERTVRFPFWDEYKEMIKSSIADIKNIGNGEAGAITAGKFLEFFVDYPWIHIDIAGTGMIEKRKSYIPSGGTGYGVRLIYEFLKITAELKE